MKSAFVKQIEIIENMFGEGNRPTPLTPDEPEDYHFGWTFGEHNSEEWHLMNREPFLFIYLTFDAPDELQLAEILEVLNYTNWKSDWGFSACRPREPSKSPRFDLSRRMPMAKAATPK